MAARRTTSIPVQGTALLLIDVINDLAFEGSHRLLEQAEPMAARLAALKARATKAGVPAIYVNDNFGQWRSDFRSTVAHCSSPACTGHAVSRRLKPEGQRLLRAQAEALRLLLDTTLETLLDSLGIRRVIVTGYGRQHLRAVHGQRRLHARPRRDRARRTASSPTPWKTMPTRCVRSNWC